WSSSDLRYIRVPCSYTSHLSFNTLHCFFFFFNDTAPTEIYPLSLHDALPISASTTTRAPVRFPRRWAAAISTRSEEHTSELQSLTNLVCRLLLEKKKKPD